MSKLPHIFILNIRLHALYVHTYLHIPYKLVIFDISIQFSCSVMSDSLRPHELHHTRPPCPSPTPRIYPNPCPLSRWCRPTISSSVIPFSSCPQSFPASGSFQMSHVFITCTLKLVFIKTLPKPLGPYTFVLQSSSMSFNWNES